MSLCCLLQLEAARFHVAFCAWLFSCRCVVLGSCTAVWHTALTRCRRTAGVLCTGPGSAWRLQYCRLVVLSLAVGRICRCWDTGTATLASPTVCRTSGGTCVQFTASCLCCGAGVPACLPAGVPAAIGAWQTCGLVSTSGDSCWQQLHGL
jgi:hypothetical protein